VTAAATDRLERVRVIVQKQTTLETPEAATIELGGDIILALPMINGFVAEISSTVVPRLAARSDIRHISFDAPVVTVTVPMLPGSSAGMGHSPAAPILVWPLL
jgi:hypothetical protein